MNRWDYLLVLMASASFPNLALAQLNPPPVVPTETDERRAEERAKEIEKFLEGVKESDQRLAPKFDMPAEQIKAATTQQLLKHFVASPIWTFFLMHDDPIVAMRRAINSSQTLSAFMKRPDIIEGIVAYNNEAIKEMEGISSEKEAKDKDLSWRLWASDNLLLYPEVFEKTKGQETKILRVLCQRYRAMVATNLRLGKEKEGFGVSLSTTAYIARRLIGIIDPSARANLPLGGPELYAIAEELVSKI